MSSAAHITFPPSSVWPPSSGWAEDLAAHRLSTGVPRSASSLRFSPSAARFYSASSPPPLVQSPFSLPSRTKSDTPLRPTMSSPPFQPKLLQCFLCSRHPQLYPQRQPVRDPVLTPST